MIQYRNVKWHKEIAMWSASLAGRLAREDSPEGADAR
jgi:hypothetical protein